MRLFLDANVLFTAAHNPKGKAAHLFELAEKGHWEVATSTYAINETRRNLLLKHPSSVAQPVVHPTDNCVSASPEGGRGKPPCGVAALGKGEGPFPAGRALHEDFPRPLIHNYQLDAPLDSLLEQVHRAEHHPGLFCPTSLSAKDRPIFQAALACGATDLLTGDFKDFGEFMGNPDKTKGIRIMTVAVFLRSVRSQYDLGRGIRTSPH